MRIPRRLLLTSLAVTLAVGCRPSAPRCKTCGMKIDPSSAWRTELLDHAGGVAAAFDTPRCAFAAWRSGKVSASALRVPEYYDRVPRTGDALRFVIGSDVLGPMGPDLVPVEPTKVPKFLQDHAAERALTVAEITETTLAGLR